MLRMTSAMVVVSCVDQADRLFTQCAHALFLCQAAQFVLRRPADDEALDLGRHLQELVDADAVLVAGLPAEVAAGALAEVGLGRPAALLVEGHLLLGRRVRRLARRADATNQALSDDGDDRRRDRGTTRFPCRGNGGGRRPSRSRAETTGPCGRSAPTGQRSVPSRRRGSRRRGSCPGPGAEWTSGRWRR